MSWVNNTKSKCRTNIRPKSAEPRALQLNKTYTDQVSNTNQKKSFNVIYAVSNVQFYLERYWHIKWVCQNALTSENHVIEYLCLDWSSVCSYQD